MSEALINSLQKRVDELTGEVATLRTEAKSRRIKAKGLGEENEALKAQLATITTERDGLRSRADAAPTELQARLDEALGKLRDRDHRDKFNELAGKAGVTQPKALADLWSLSGYKAEADEVDDVKITTAITAALEGRDWLKTPAADAANGTPAGAGTTGTQAAPKSETRNPGPGVHRGGASGKGDPEAALAAAYPNAYRIA